MTSMERAERALELLEQAEEQIKKYHPKRSEKLKALLNVQEAFNLVYQLANDVSRMESDRRTLLDLFNQQAQYIQREVNVCNPKSMTL